MKKFLIGLFAVLSLCISAFAQSAEVAAFEYLFRPTREQILQAQKILKVSETGKIDQEYSAALKNYQTKNGMIASGYLGRVTLGKMGIALTDKQKVANSAKNQKCPNFSPLQNICISVGSALEDSNPINPEYQYVYQYQVLEASCADPEIETDEIINKKISGMFTEFNSQLTCQFEITNGSLLKYGVVFSADSDAFIYDIIMWGVNLNNPDPKDGGNTLLDYLQKKHNENKNTALGNIFQGYYKRLRTAGAKHKSEL